MLDDYKHGKYFAANREKLYVKTSPGRDKKLPVLMCNGLGIDLHTLDPLANALGESTVIRFDPPGIGGSSPGNLPYRLGHLARVLANLLDELNLDQVDVVGISWGGLLAQEFALTFPSRCRRLILAATTMGMVSIPGNIFLQGLFSNPLFWLGKDMADKMAALVYGGDLRLPGSTFQDYQNLLSFPMPGYLWQILAITGWTSAHRLNKLKQPVLLMAAKDDPIVPLVNAKLMQKLVPNCRLVEFDCGHLFPFTRVAQFAREIQKFRR